MSDEKCLEQRAVELVEQLNQLRDDRGAMAGIVNFYLTGRFGQPADQRSVLTRQNAFAKKAVDMGDNLAERQGHPGQAAE